MSKQDDSKNWLVHTNEEFGGVFVMPVTDPVGTVYVMTKVAKDHWIIQASGGSIPRSPLQ